MDLLSHIATGVAVSTVVASHRSVQTTRSLVSLLFIGVLAGALPDLDVLTMWSGFDSTFGKWFQLQTSGRELYFQKHWFSHHGAMHSLFASVFFPLLFLIVQSLLSKNQGFISALEHKWKQNSTHLIAFFLAYNLHLLEDMITPGLTWGGVNYFFPFNVYVGGWEKVWWWNNYDLFLVIIMVVVANAILLTCKQHWKLDLFLPALCLFLLGVALFCFQVNSRGESFVHNRGGDYATPEKRSKEIQIQILGKSGFQTMKKLDNVIPIAF